MVSTWPGGSSATPANTVRGATTDQNVNVWSRPTGSNARRIVGSAAKIAFTSLAK